MRVDWPIANEDESWAKSGLNEGGALVDFDHWMELKELKNEKLEIQIFSER